MTGQTYVSKNWGWFGKQDPSIPRLLSQPKANQQQTWKCVETLFFSLSPNQMSQMAPFTDVTMFLAWTPKNRGKNLFGEVLVDTTYLSASLWAIPPFYRRCH